MDQQADELLFVDEENRVDRDAGPAWRVLIVDDEREVHVTTVFALGRTQILGRELEFLHAYSADQARQILETTPDIAAILLDVVMERENSGLTLVHEIRNVLQLRDVRIILRTGQSGYAPEIEAIRDYDINDYKNKSELTRTKLFTTLTVAIRSYEQLRAANASRRGLEMIVSGSAELIALHGIEAFSAGVITQLSGLLGLEPEGLVCAQLYEESSDTCGSVHVLAAAGRFAGFVNRSLELIDDPEIRDVLNRCFSERTTIHHGMHTAILLSDSAGRMVAAYLHLKSEPSELDKSLLGVFCSNISVCVDNLGLFERLHSFAYFDQMLDLPNRTGLVTKLDKLVASGGAGECVLALIDIDHFSETNDALGHAYGDQLLKAVAERLAGLCNASTTVSRISGDVFAIVGKPDVVHPRNIRALFGRPFVVDGNHHVVSSTMGFVCLCDVDGGGADVLKNANIALNRAKSGDRGTHSFYERSMGIELRERVNLLHELRSAFDRERLFLNYQPQLDLRTGAVVGAEALIRWKKDDGTFISPQRFIPLAEYSGLIVPIGQWVLRTACHQQVRLERQGFTGFRMAVNVAAMQFRHPQFLDMLDAALADTGAAAQNIELEITESAAMLDTANLVGLLNAIKKRGVTVAIDDFGTGFSSLSYLQQLNVDRLKIDQSFVSQMTIASSAGQSIARMITELGRNLGLVVIAEGVEDPVQAAALVELGCHEAQGYWFAKPMPGGELSAWLAAHPMASAG